MEDLTIALWQTPFASGSAEALQRLDAAAERVRAEGAELLVTPEMALTGYAIGADRVATLAEPASGPLAQAVGAIARRHGLAIAYGYPEAHADGAPYNAAQFIDADGKRLANYRKTHLFGNLDRSQFSAGEAAPRVFMYRGWRLGLLICYDVEFPEAVRLLALQGADAVLVPTANMEPFDEVQRVLLPARALENRLYVAYANACGQEAGLAYNGLSGVYGPAGRTLAQATSPDVGLVQVTLSSSALAAARTTSPLHDRRGDLYGLPTD